MVTFKKLREFSNDKQGDCGVIQAIAAVTRAGLDATNESEKGKEWDILIDMYGGYKKEHQYTQCKTADSYTSAGHPIVCLSYHRTNSIEGHFKTLQHYLLDAVMVLTEDGRMWWIPINRVTQSTQMTLNKRYDDCQFNPNQNLIPQWVKDKYWDGMEPEDYILQLRDEQRVRLRKPRLIKNV